MKTEMETVLLNRNDFSDASVFDALIETLDVENSDYLREIESQQTFENEKLPVVTSLRLCINRVEVADSE